MAFQLTDHVLLQCAVSDDSGLADTVARWCARSPWPMRCTRLAWRRDSRQAYAYAQLDQPQDLDAHATVQLTALWAKLQASETTGAALQGETPTVSRLALQFDAPGVSSGAAVSHHYVVEMNPEPGWQAELFNWYDSEHMPGLAAVPGCVHARRFVNHDHGPLSLACYDLTHPETLGSAPWLAVRNTAWSDRVRPHFMDTRRTMMELIA